MEKSRLDELCARKKRQVVKLIEVADVTRQVAEAVERGDGVSAELLLSEREQPVRELAELEEEARACVLRLSEEDAIRAGELLRGAEAETEDEKPLVEQISQFRRILSSVVALDRQVSLRLGGSRSFYKKFR